MVTDLGRKFKAWRGTRTQQEAADIFGIKQAALSMWETGKRKPHLLRASDIEEKTEGAVTEEAIRAAHRKKKR